MGWAPHVGWGAGPSTGAGGDGDSARGARAEGPGPCQAQFGGKRLPASFGGPQHPSWVRGVCGGTCKGWGKAILAMGCVFLQETPVSAEVGAAAAPSPSIPWCSPAPGCENGGRKLRLEPPSSSREKSRKQQQEKQARLPQLTEVCRGPARGGKQMVCRGTAPARGSGAGLGLMSSAHVKPPTSAAPCGACSGARHCTPPTHTPPNPQLNTINYS